MKQQIKDFLSLLFRFKLNDLFAVPTTNMITQLFRTCFVGGIATIVELLICALVLKIFTSVSTVEYIATAVGFAISTFINFILSRFFVFSANEARMKISGELFGFCAISAIGLCFKELLVFLFCNIIPLGYWPAWIIATCLVLLWNYIGRRFFLYK